MAHVGIDLHKAQSQICVLHEDGRVWERRVMTRADRLRKALQEHRGCPVLIEASTESQWAAECLEADGHTVIVADPNFAPMYGMRQRRSKTDLRDARALAEACRTGTYRRSHRASEGSRAIRIELRVRAMLVRQRAAQISLVRTLARSEGARIPNATSRSFVTQVRHTALSERLTEQLQPLLTMIGTLCDQIAILDTRLAERARDHPAARLLCTAPAVGVVTALAFVAALDDAERFADAEEVASFLGLVPREWSSGERHRAGHIHKAGPSQVRWLLVEGAWRILLLRDPASEPLRHWAQRIAVRRGRWIAIVALARRLGCVLYAMWRSGQPYSAARLTSRRAVAVA